MNEFRNGIKKVTKETGWTLRTVLFRVVLPLIFFMVVIGAILVVIQLASQPAKVISKVIEADNILYNYEWFKRTYQDVKAIDLKIKNTGDHTVLFDQHAGARENWTFEDKNEYARLNTILLGLKNQRQDIIANYNARSKMASRAIFKSKELPEQLE